LFRDWELLLPVDAVRYRLTSVIEAIDRSSRRRRGLPGIVSMSIPAFMLVLLTATLARADVTITLDTHGGEMAVAGRLETRFAGSARPTPKVPVPISGRSVTLGLSHGNWEVTGEIPGYYVPLQLLKVRTGDEEVHVSAWPTARVHGTVAAPASNPPPKMLELRWSPAEGSGPPAGSVFCPTTDDQWQCEVPAGTLDLRIRSTGYLTHFRWYVVLTAGKPLDWGRLRLARGASVIGRVSYSKNQRGGRLKDVRVALRHASVAAAFDAASSPEQVIAIPGERGFFSFEGIAPGSYTISASAPGGLATDTRELSVAANREAELTTPLILEPLHSMRLQITPGRGAADAAWHVSLFALDPLTHHQQVVARGVTAADGSWEPGGLRPGSYVIVVGSEGADTVARKEFRIESADAVVDLTIPVTHVRGTLKLGDQPLAATVWVGGKRRSPSMALTADAGGAFAGDVSLLPGEQWPLTIVSEQPRIERTIVESAILSDDGSVHLDVVIPRSGLHGTVVDERGTPVGRTIVTLTTSDPTQTVVQTHGDAGGQFQLLGLEPGQYTVEAITFDHRQSKPALAVVETGTETEVHLVVEAQRGLVGRIVAQRAPVPGAGITVVPTNVEVALWPNGVTDEQGEFAVQLPPGAAEGNIAVAAPGFAFKLFHLKLPDDAIVIAVDPSGGSLEIEVPPFADDPALPQPFVVHRGAELHVQFLTSVRGVSTVDGGHGRMRIIHSLMEPGEYALCSVMLNQRPMLRSGMLPAEHCVSGVLAPFGSLRLTLPAVVR